MMQAGQKIEKSLGRGEEVIHWIEGDASKPESLARLPLRFKEEGYDMVTANWLFDHAGSMDTLDGMFRSVVAYLKPGGRFVGTRVIHGHASPAATTGKYGYIYDSSKTPDDKYGVYNWCNMPHVRKTEYVKASDEFELQYVEVVSIYFPIPSSDDAFAACRVSHARSI